MEKIHWEVRDPRRRPNISEDPLAPDVMGDVIIRSSLAVGQKRVSIKFGWTSEPTMPTSSWF